MNPGAGRQYGFTLLEVSIVLLLVAALSGLALGGFNMALERTQANDALKDLSDLVVGMRRCQMLHGTPGCVTNIGDFLTKASMSEKYETSAYNRSVEVDDDGGRPVSNTGSEQRQGSAVPTCWGLSCSRIVLSPRSWTLPIPTVFRSAWKWCCCSRSQGG